MGLPPQAPEACVYTNFTTSAGGITLSIAIDEVKALERRIGALIRQLPVDRRSSLLN
jgi:hypothetical protein